MDSYTITIAPNDDTGATTRLVVDTAGDEVRITDVHLHAPAGLSSGHIPAVDFELLLRAVTGGTAGPGGATVVGATALAGPETLAIESAAPESPEPLAAAAPAPAPARRPRAKAAPAPAAGRRRAAKATATSPAKAAKRSPAKATTRSPAKAAEQTPAKRTPAKRAAKRVPAEQAPTKRTRATAAKASPSRAAKQTAAKQTPAKQTPAKQTAATQTAAKKTAAKKTQPAVAGTGRVYRPTPRDLSTVLDRVKTVAAVAEHYQVPRYTAQGWVGRLRAAAK